MNKRQKALLINFITVIFVTVSFIVAMTIVKDWLNKSESLRAMEHLGREVLSYRQKRGSLPPETYLEPIKRQLVRLGKISYRAQLVDFESPPGTVLDRGTLLLTGLPDWGQLHLLGRFPSRWILKM